MPNLSSRNIGPFKVFSVGFGCMNISHAYGTPPPPDEAEQLLEEAFARGVNFFDTAALYGFGSNEELLARSFLKKHRQQIVLASKGGMAGVDGKRVINGRPEAIRKNCEDSLRRLQTDVIDLYYLHRVDKSVPIEDSVGEMSRLVNEGKIQTIGLSEASSASIQRAHAIHPITALQTEYSLWTRNPEISVLKTCEQLGIHFVAFSPVARGYLGGRLNDVSKFEEKDIRRAMPRFYPENYPKNLELLDQVREIAMNLGQPIATVAIAWLLNRSENITPIPGTTKVAHLIENIAAANLELDASTMQALDEILNQHTVVGTRYNPATQAEIDTEEFN